MRIRVEYSPSSGTLTHSGSALTRQMSFIVWVEYVSGRMLAFQFGETIPYPGRKI